jgi:hypothetical protein
VVKILGLIAGITPIVALAVFGIKLSKAKTSLSVATWLMWTVLNTILMTSMIAAGNTEAWLPAGFAVGSLFIAIILLTKGNWKWGSTETTCAVGAAVTMALWYASGPKLAIIAGCIAMWCASGPLIRETWENPDWRFWWLWTASWVAALVAMFVAKAWTIEDRCFAASSFLFNFLMMCLSLRQDPRVSAMMYIHEHGSDIL